MSFMSRFFDKKRLDRQHRVWHNRATSRETSKNANAVVPGRSEVGPMLAIPPLARSRDASCPTRREGIAFCQFEDG